MLCTARHFNCVRCHTRVIICSRCDRGQIYCASDCAKQARKQYQKSSCDRYRLSRKGRLNNALRQRRHRSRIQQKVTEHGSVQSAFVDSIPDKTSTCSTTQSPTCTAAQLNTLHCHFCIRACDEYVRHGFLRRRSGKDPPPRSLRRTNNT